MPRVTRTQRSEEAQAWRHLYKTARWQKLRKAQLMMQPLCERSLARGETVAADTVNHRIPHKGNIALFFDPDNLESVSKRVHDSEIQSEERSGYSKAIGEDGWPVDERHPANRCEQ